MVAPDHHLRVLLDGHQHQRFIPVDATEAITLSKRRFGYRLQRASLGRPIE